MGACAWKWIGRSLSGGNSEREKKIIKNGFGGEMSGV